MGTVRAVVARPGWSMSCTKMSNGVPGLPCGKSAVVEIVTATRLGETDHGNGSCRGRAPGLVDELHEDVERGPRPSLREIRRRRNSHRYPPGRDRSWERFVPWSRARAGR